jgi:hypothetical protein
VDVEKCQALLLNAYEHARCMPLQDKGIVESGMCDVQQQVQYAYRLLGAGATQVAF